MKKKKLILIMMLCAITLSATGCTTLLKDEKGKAVQNPVTGQNLPKNILCRPESKKTIEVYEDNKIELNKLPKCSEFVPASGGYEGIWTTIFVKPLAWIIIQIGKIVKNYGLAVILITLLIRMIMFPLTQKSAVQSENLKLAKPELDKLEKKYKNRQDQEAMMQKSQEMLVIYKKYKINPMAGCLYAFIQLPLFLAFYEALNRLPLIFEGSFLGLHLGMTPLTGITSGRIYYIIIVILVGLVTYYSFKLNSGASMSEDQAKQMKMMTNIMTGVITLSSLTISSAIGLYWITNSGFTIVQNLIVKRRKNNGKDSNRR
ncbi:MAG: YidC/Oxa1 family membrane protein insertase [Bacilli bacterium]|nr:YidC/Oxa1 family membrane protein insertase [Bacilli bacterium]